MNGFGVLYYPSGKAAYQGNWFYMFINVYREKDKFSGKGILYNEHPKDLDTEFDYRNFDLIQNYWSKYEGLIYIIYLFFLEILNRIKKMDMDIFY